MLTLYRRADGSDVGAMARIRAMVWGTEAYWQNRIAGYLNGQHHPQQALPPRVAYVAVLDGSLTGFVAGHLTRRYACDGELEWINVVPEHRGDGTASELLKRLAAWFAEQDAAKICVNVAPENETARRFYRRHGATELNPYWMIWHSGVACDTLWPPLFPSERP